ncbi:MAG: RNA pseudouridine synthase, partial [Clostridiales bacterium]|nr:RNA pseudouridine synthase [Clostridiales bacterium]
MDKPTILYEDNHVIVAVKPPNLLTQGDETGDESLLDQVKAYVKETYNKPGEAYIGLVHRMDRPVGGLLVFART